MNVKKVIKNLIHSEQKKIQNITFNIRRKIEGNYIIKDITFFDKGNNHHFQEKVKAITLSDFSNFISNVELKIIDIFGSYKLEDFNAITSDRLILICKK